MIQAERVHGVDGGSVPVLKLLSHTSQIFISLDFHRRMRVRFKASNCLGVITLSMTVIASDIRAQDLEPRSYANTPVGMNFLIMGYGRTQGGVATDPALPVKDARVEVDSATLAYARSLGLWGKSAKFNIVLPYGWASGSATAKGQFHDREISGFIDPRFQFSINLFGAPALSMEEFPKYQQDIIIGFTLSVTAPGGQYDPNKLLNLGTNRWSVKPELGISKRWGPLTFELAGGVRFYTDNEDFLGGEVREQAPIYSVQSHLIYSLPYGIWASAGSTYYTGGRTHVDGVRNSDLQQNTRVGVTLALPLSRYQSIKMYFNTGVSTSAGTDFDAMGILWQYRFGDQF